MLALDGVRGVAILLVLLLHGVDLSLRGSAPDRLLSDVASVGWSGVDLFFVLSGLLITGILLDTKDRPHYYRNFYARRVLRIVPLYYAFLLLAVVVAAWQFRRTGSSEAATLLANQGWYWSYLTNVLQARDGMAAMPWHTAHLWSLAVEEHFYLLWAPLVALLSRPALRRVAWGVVAMAIGLRTLIVLSGVLSPLAAYVLTPTRADELALGALLALAAREPGALERWRRWIAPLAMCGALTLVTLTFWRDGLYDLEPPVQLIGYPAVTCLAVATIAHLLLSPRGRLARAMEHPTLRFFGRYSYGMYIAHFPIALVIKRYVLPASRLPRIGDVLIPGRLLFLTLVVGLTVLAALASWWLLESRALRLKSRFADVP